MPEDEVGVGAEPGSEVGTEGSWKKSDEAVDDRVRVGARFPRSAGSIRLSKSSRLGKASSNRVDQSGSSSCTRVRVGPTSTPPAGPRSLTPFSRCPIGAPPSGRNCKADSSHTLAGSCTLE